VMGAIGGLRELIGRGGVPRSVEDEKNAAPPGAPRKLT
jgi:hypothetical protein